MNKLTQYNKGFLEALIDGEGCLTLSKYKTKYETICFRPELRIANNDKKLLLKAQKIIGEKYSWFSESKNTYYLVLKAEGLRKLLPMLNLIVKEKQRIYLIKALKILKIRRYGRGKRHPKYRYSDLVNFYKQMRKR